MKILLFLSSLILLASCMHAPVSPSPKTDTMMKDDVKMEDTMTKDQMMSGTLSTGTVIAPSADASSSGAIVTPGRMKPNGYIEYRSDILDSALQSGQKVVLFFHATWCPTCKAFEKNINTNLSTIPTDTLILKVDYDSENELKKKYVVTVQHTTVVLNQDGTEKSKKLGAKTVEEVLN